MTDPTKPNSSANSRHPPSADPVAGRRRLLQGGLAAGPVLMTLVSRPVLAQQAGLCTTPSGFVSANASTAGRGVTCTGHTPAYWADPLNFGQWPTGAGYFPTKVTGPGGHNATTFQDVFNPKLILPGNGNPTLLEVLVLTGNPTNDVARYVSAAVLNAAAGLTPVLLVPAVKDIWSEFATTGFFSPSSGARWDANEIIAYLQTTMQ